MKNNLKKHVLLFSFCLLIFSGCKKDKDTHPEVQTREITVLSPVRIAIKGTIVTKGSYTTIDHGFIYGTNSNLSETFGTKISLGAEVQEGEFSKEITNIYNNGYGVIYARAYITNSNGTVYGQTISAQLPQIGASSMVPTMGKSGDLITINGQFYSLKKDEVSITFAGVLAKVTEVTSTLIKVEVPKGINTNSAGYYSNQIPVILLMGGQSLNVSYSFRLVPTFSSFSPAAGPAGTLVTITGDNISGNYSYNSVKVSFGQVQGSISSYGPNGIVVSVPGSLTAINNDISVEIDGVKSVLPGQFTLTPHTVTSISPTSGLSGGSFSIFGTNFSSNYSTYPIVTIGNIPASVSYVSSGQLNVTIPTNLPAGEYKVLVISGPFSIEATQKLTVKELSVSSFSPLSGGVGKEITLQGNFIPNQYYQVYFGSTASSTTASSSTSLKTAVPYGISPGNVRISVKNGAQSADAPGNFTVLAPAITSFSPTSGVAGTVVTISGSGFNQYASNNTVKFGTVSTIVLSATESSITVAVPSNLNPGAMKISILNNGQTIVSADNFTVTN